MKTQTLRRSFQILTLLLVINAGLGYAMGWMTFGVERFCPFGGIETLWAVATKQSFTCAMGPFNLSLMLALLAMTLVARKAFCSWVCPVGTVSEWLGMLGRRLRLWRGKLRGSRSLGFFFPSSQKDAAWRWIRLPVLAVILYFTVGTSELIFRPFDPYYVLFSAHGHDVQMWSYLVLGAILLASVILPMVWCRYLCPLGGSLWPFSRFAWLRIARSEISCTSCGKCDAVCPHGIPVSSVNQVDSGECTLCMECTSACPKNEALALSSPGKPSRAVPAWAVAMLVVLASGVGYISAGAFAFSSVEHIYEVRESKQGLEQLTLYVDGVMCVDTAETAALQLESMPGMISLIAYAADNRLEIEYDGSLLTSADIVKQLEAPVYNAETEEFYFGVFRVREVQEQKR